MMTMGFIVFATWKPPKVLCRRDEIDHAHNGYSTAVVHVRFRHPLLAGPYVSGLRDKLLVRPLTDLQLTFKANDPEF